MFADALAFGGTPTVLDLGTTSPGTGKPIRCFISTLTALTGCTGLIVTDGATVTAADALVTFDDPIAAVGTLYFTLPAKTQRYVKIALEGTVLAGTYTAGVHFNGAQTNV
jgi:hypothetical protein